MKPKTKSRIKIALLALGAALLIFLPLLLTGCGKTEPNRVIEGPGEIKPVTPTPTPLAITQETMNKMIADALAKAIPTPTPAPIQKMSPIPIPEEIFNPFETDEDRALKAARKGFAIVDETGQRWAVVSRDDGAEVTKGLPVELTTITSGENVPFVARESDGWKVRWKKPDSNRSTPNPLIEPTVPPTPAPTPSATATQSPSATPAPSASGSPQTVPVPPHV